MLRKLVLQGFFLLALAVFAGALFMFGTLSATAQPVGEGQRPPRPEEMLKSLKLSGQQSTVVQNILDSERQAMMALNDSIRPQRDAIFQSTRKKLAATLTPEQLQRYDEWREANRPPRPNDGPGGARGNSPDGARPRQPQ